MYYVYILQSIKDGQLYYGSTNDLKRRLLEHNAGKNESTKIRRPFDIIYYEAYRAESDARSREHSLKLRGNALAQLRKRISKSLRSELGVRVNHKQ